MAKKNQTKTKNQKTGASMTRQKYTTIAYVYLDVSQISA